MFGLNIEILIDVDFNSVRKRELFRSKWSEINFVNLVYDKVKCNWIFSTWRIVFYGV